MNKHPVHRRNKITVLYTEQGLQMNGGITRAVALGKRCPERSEERKDYGKSQPATQQEDMECEFERIPARECLASWLMGDWRFEALDLSAQQWIWKPGPGLQNWRTSSLVMLLNESGKVEIEQHGEIVTVTEESLIVFDGSVKYNQTSFGNCRSAIIRVPKAALTAGEGLWSNRAMFVLESTAPDVAFLISQITAATAFGERCSIQGGGLVAKYLSDLMQLISDDLTTSMHPATSSVAVRKVKLSSSATKTGRWVNCLTSFTKSKMFQVC